MVELGTGDGSDVVVLRTENHGMPVEEYVAAIRGRLPDLEVAHARTPAEERSLVAQAPVVTGTGISTDLLERAEDLRLFACTSAGYEHLPLDALVERGVTVTNAAGVHGPNIAEQIVGWLLTFARGLHEAHRRQRNREWRHFQVQELKGSTVTVVGLGAIGQATVERLEGFDVETLGVRYTPEKGGPTDEVFGFEDIDEALYRTDYLVLACPLTDTTEGLVGAAEFDTLPPDAVLVNVGRGPIVDTDALLGAVRGNRVDGAALDVTDPEPLPEDHPLWNFENVLITPHNAGHTPEYYERCADILARNVAHVRDAGFEDLENQVAP